MDHESLTYDEIVDASIINVIPKNDTEKYIIDFKQKQFEDFKPLLKHYIGDKEKITSEEVVSLWQFYLQGIRVHIFKQEEYDYNHIHEEAGKFIPLLNSSIEDIMKCPFRYQIAYHFLASSARIKEAERQYETIFKDESDPIQWFIKNSNSFILDTKMNRDILRLWNNIYITENTKFDPILQT